jgi:hypothetical protein
MIDKGPTTMMIEIDDKFWTDFRFFDLSFRLASLHGMPVIQARAAAIGFLVLGWKVAQEYFCNKDDPCQPIPFDRWESENLPGMIVDVGLARVLETGIEMNGSMDKFSWWLERCESGRRGGVAKAQNIAKSKQLLSNPSTTIANPSKTLQTLAPVPIPIPIDRSKKNTNTLCQQTPDLEQESVIAKSGDLRPCSPPSHTNTQVEDKNAATGRKSGKHGNASGLPSPEEIKQVWNSLRHPKLSAVAVMSDDRKRKIEKRAKEFPDIEQWKIAIKNLSSWKWGQGENSTGWVASLDYLLSEKGRRAFEGPLAGTVTRRAANGDTDYRDQGFRGDDEAIIRAFGEEKSSDPF